MIMQVIGARGAGALCSIVLAGASVARAGDLTPPPGPVQPTGPTALNAQSIELPYVIDEPGSYVLTSNLTGAPGENGIVVMADDVTIDLNGFAMIGAGGEGGDAIYLPFNDDEIRPFLNLTIRDGHIRGWGGDGVHAEGEQIVVDRVTSTGNAGYGIRVSIGAIVRHSAARSNGAIGIFGHLTTVQNCMAIGNADVGIKTVGGSIVNCTASLNLADGLRAFDGGVIADSAAFNNQIGIIAADGSVVKNCSVFNNFSNGVEASNGSTIDSCAVRGNLGAGVALEQGSTLKDSTITSNLSDGVRADQGARIVDNNVQGHGAGYGILVTADNNRIEGNNITGGQTAVRVWGLNNLVIRNSVSGNSGQFQISAGNSFGPVVNVSGSGNMAGSPGTTHPWANFQY